MSKWLERDLKSWLIFTNTHPAPKRKGQDLNLRRDKPTPAFQASALNHSATLPLWCGVYPAPILVSLINFKKASPKFEIIIDLRPVPAIMVYNNLQELYCNKKLTI